MVHAGGAGCAARARTPRTTVIQGGGPVMQVVPATTHTAHSHTYVYSGESSSGVAHQMGLDWVILVVCVRLSTPPRPPPPTITPEIHNFHPLSQPQRQIPHVSPPYLALSLEYVARARGCTR